MNSDNALTEAQKLLDRSGLATTLAQTQLWRKDLEALSSHSALVDARRLLDNSGIAKALEQSQGWQEQIEALSSRSALVDARRLLDNSGIAKALEQSQGWQEQMEALSSRSALVDARRLLDNSGIAKALEQSQGWQEQMEALSFRSALAESRKLLDNSGIAKALEQTQRWQEEMESLSSRSAFVDARKLLDDSGIAKALEQTQRWQQEMESLSSHSALALTQKLLGATSLTKILEQARQWQESMPPSLPLYQNAARQFEELAGVQFVVDANNGITLGQHFVSLAEFETDLNELFAVESVGPKTLESKSLAQRIAQYWQDNPIKAYIIDRVLWSIIIAFFISVTSNLATPDIHDVLSPPAVDPRSAVKYVQRELPKLVDRETLAYYRVVTPAALVVRERPNSKSPEIGTLLAGTVVLFVRKEKDWTLVEYENRVDEGRVSGWAYSRYLRRVQ